PCLCLDRGSGPGSDFPAPVAPGPVGLGSSFVVVAVGAVARRERLLLWRRPLVGLAALWREPWRLAPLFVGPPSVWRPSAPCVRRRCLLSFRLGIHGGRCLSSKDQGRWSSFLCPCPCLYLCQQAEAVGGSAGRFRQFLVQAECFVRLAQSSDL